MSHNALSGTIPSSYGSLPSLRSLDASYNDLNGVIPQALTCLTALTYVRRTFD